MPLRNHGSGSIDVDWWNEESRSKWKNLEKTHARGVCPSRSPRDTWASSIMFITGFRCFPEWKLIKECQFCRCNFVFLVSNKIFIRSGYASNSTDQLQRVYWKCLFPHNNCLFDNRNRKNLASPFQHSRSQIFPNYFLHAQFTYFFCLVKICTLFTY